MATVSMFFKSIGRDLIAKAGKDAVKGIAIRTRGRARIRGRE